MSLWQNYLRPRSLAEALDAFSTAPKPLAPIAGGTDLLIDLQQGRHPPVQTLVDVSEIEEMLALEIRDDRLFVGAGVPVNRIVRDPLAGAHAQALVEACELIAGPQVRNVATLGGNVAHALPAADGTIALLALDAQAEVARLAAGAMTSKRIAFADLFRGPGQSSLTPGVDLLVGFYLPLQKVGEASCFKRIMRPQGVALPILNCAAWLARSADTVRDVRIAVGPGSATPFRAESAEAALRGAALDSESLARAEAALLNEAHFRSSARRASAEYRNQIVGELFTSTIEAAWNRAGTSPKEK